MFNVRQILSIFNFCISAFLVNSTAPNKQFSRSKSKLLRFELSLYTMYVFTIVPWLHVVLSCFKQVPLTFNFIC